MSIRWVQNITLLRSSRNEAPDGLNDQRLLHCHWIDGWQIGKGRNVAESLLMCASFCLFFRLLKLFRSRGRFDLGEIQ